MKGRSHDDRQAGRTPPDQKHRKQMRQSVNGACHCSIGPGVRVRKQQKSQEDRHHPERRDRGVERSTTLRAGDLETDLIERRVSRGGAEIPLTLREFDLLAYFVRHKNAVVTRDMLGREVWKEPEHALTNVIDVYVNKLRRELEKSDKGPVILTVRGVGYTLREGPCA